MTEAFKPGDIVQLKSGGSALTVHEVYDNPDELGLTAHCYWFDDDNDLHDAWVPVVCLKKY